MRRALLLLLLLPLLAGCFGGMGVPLPEYRLVKLRGQLEEVDLRRGEDEIKDHITSLKRELGPIADSKDRSLRADAGRMHLLIGYCWERLGEYDEAVSEYEQATRGEYGSVAYFRIIQVAEHLAREATSDEERKAREKKATKALERAGNYSLGARVLLREGPEVGSLGPGGTWTVADDMRHEAHKRLDKYYRERLIYRIFDFLVTICGGEDKNASYILAIVLLAVLAKLITTPLSAAQFRNMRAMQALQPELKKLQEKHKGDKQQMARAQMELFKQHKVNPASSCLPMLIQMPILIWVYYGIRYFVFRFENVHFLYLDSLANPDVVHIGDMLWPGPLLLFYGVSMYFSQKLISPPAATPEQQQQQKLMAYMMPVLLVLILKSLPAAFILYWLLQNMLMTGHQYFIMRRGRVVQAAAGGAPPPSAPAPGPPAEALDKLSQGTRPRRKKRKRR